MRKDYRYTEVGYNAYASEASTLGIPLGSMPESVNLGAELGNGRAFTRVRTDAMGAGVYRQDGGTVSLVVFSA